MSFVLVFLCAMIIIVIFVNGFTDAVNAVSSVIATKVYTANRAVFFSGLCNLFGVIIFCTLFQNVTKTMGELVGLGNVDMKTRLLGVSTAMLSVAIFATAAWFFGIATSESHGLIGAVCGCNFALNPGGFPISALLSVVYGQVFSILFGFIAGFLFCKKMSGKKQQNINRRLKFSMAGLSFLHGGQDGQKFYAILLTLLPFFSSVKGAFLSVSFVVCIALFMALGTFFGGRRIIEKVAALTSLDKTGWLASDMASVVGIALSTFLGSPISTTYVKISAIAGSALAQKKPVDKKSLAEIGVSWAVTFPVCFVLAFVLIKIIVV